MQQIAFDRLVEVGDPEATKAHASTAVLDQVDAWADYIAASAATGEPSVGVLSALQKSDPEGFSEVHAVTADDVETGERLRSLDHMVAIGVLQVEGV